MSISFNRSMRSLRADAFRVSAVSMAVGMVLLVAWGAWFVLAPIPLRESTTDYSIARDGTVLASFAPQAQSAIQPGQTARLVMSDSGGSATKIYPAVVTGIPNRTQYGDKRGKVELTLMADAPPRDWVGRVEVEVAVISPAAFVLQTSNQLSWGSP